MNNNSNKFLGLNPSLEIYLPLNENNGTIKKDYSILKRNATAINGALPYQDHPYISGGYCTKFDGINDYASTDTNITFKDTGYLTFEFRINCNQTLTRQPIIHHGLASGVQRHLIIFRDASSDTLGIIYGDGVAPRTVPVQSFFTSVNNIWVKCKINIDFINNIIKVYKNNVLFAIPVIANKPILFPTQDIKIFIGYYSLTNVYLTGKLSDIKIYNRFI